MSGCFIHQITWNVNKLITYVQEINRDKNIKKILPEKIFEKPKAARVK